MVYRFEREEPVVEEVEDLFSDGESHLPEGMQPIETIYPVFGLAEDLLLGILRPAFEPQGITVVEQHSEGLTTPMIMCRATRASANQGFAPDDVRFMRSYKVLISSFATGVEADRLAGQMIEAAQHVLLEAWRKQTVVPGAGSIANIRAWVDPVRVSDFQTATNIVQYPSLPKGHVRYEQNFNIMVRPDFRGSSNPFIRASLVKE